MCLEGACVPSCAYSGLVCLEWPRVPRVAFCATNRMHFVCFSKLERRRAFPPKSKTRGKMVFPA